MTNASFFNIIFVWPILNILIGIYHGLYFFHIPYSLGFSIILLTILVRLILSPLTASQLIASRKMQKVAPHIQRLKEKHKNDAKMLQSETMRLYKEHGINPAAGCLPVLLQLPLIWGLYSVLQHVVALKTTGIVDDINKIVYFKALRLQNIWDQHFFGLQLGQSPAKQVSEVGFLILLFPVFTALFQFAQSKMLFMPPEEKEEPKEEKQKKSDDFSSIMQTQSMYIFPIMIGFFSYTLPLGLSLYWNTFTIFGIIQQYVIQGWGGLQPLIDKYIKRKDK